MPDVGYSSRPLLDALRDADRNALGALLADEVAFNSPVATYKGADMVLRVLGTAADVIDDLRAERELSSDDETVTFITGRIGENALDGVLVQRPAANGRIAEVTLMLRPLEALLAGVKEMQQRLS
jgi:hypothetical protein